MNSISQQRLFAPCVMGFNTPQRASAGKSFTPKRTAGSDSSREVLSPSYRGASVRVVGV